MSTWYLLNAGTSQSAGLPQKLLPGTLVDDAKISLAPFQAQGAVFWPSSDTYVAAAAATAQKFASRGANEAELTAIMLGGMATSLLNASGQSSAVQGAIKVQTLSLTTAQINALTSGTAFNVGAALPTGAVLVGANASWVAMTGGSLSAVTLVIGDATTSNDIMTSQSTFTTGSANSSAVSSRSGGQVKATLTATGDTLANATTGSLTINLYYAVT